MLAGDQHHVTTDHFAQRAFGKELISKAVQQGNLAVVFTGPLIDGQKAFVSVEAEVPGVVVGEVPGAVFVTDDEELNETQ